MVMGKNSRQPGMTPAVVGRITSPFVSRLLVWHRLVFTSSGVCPGFLSRAKKGGPWCGTRGATTGPIAPTSHFGGLWADDDWTWEPRGNQSPALVQH